MAKRKGDYWATPGLFGFNALTAFIDAFGTEALGWGPETVEMEIRDEWGVDADDGNFERLMTAIQVLTTDAFFTSPVDFARGCVCLSGSTPVRDSFALPDADDCAWGITEAALVRTPDGDQPFSPEVVELVGQVLRAEGVLTPPDVLRIAGSDQGAFDRVSADYSDDPELYAAITANAKGYADALESVVRGRLRALLEQLKTLPLGTAAGRDRVVEALGKLPPAEARPLT